MWGPLFVKITVMEVNSGSPMLLLSRPLFPFQKVTYKTKRPMFDLRTIAEVEGAGVKAGKHAEWKEQIIVPPLPQSALAGCSLIDIDYFIQVSGRRPRRPVKPARSGRPGSSPAMWVQCQTLAG